MAQRSVYERERGIDGRRMSGDDKNEVRATVTGGNPLDINSER